MSLFSPAAKKNGGGKQEDAAQQQGGTKAGEIVLPSRGGTESLQSPFAHALPPGHGAEDKIQDRDQISGGQVFPQGIACGSQSA